LKMTKFFKISFLALLVVSLMASGAWAGSISLFNAGVNNAPAYNIALEAMGVARTFTLVGSQGTGGNAGYNNAALRINPGQQLASGSILTVSFVNMGFNGANVGVCAANSDVVVNGTPVAAATPTANATGQNFVLGSTVASGQVLFLTTDNSGNCNASNGAANMSFQPVTSAGLATMSYSVAISGTTYDSSSKVGNIANITKQMTTAYNAGTSNIDYTVAANANGSKFVNIATATNAAASGNANIAVGAFNLNAASAAPAGAGLTVSAILSLQDSAGWAGVADIYVNGTGACTLSSNNAINNAPSGTVNLTIPGNAFNGTASFTPSVCADVLGNQSLSARSIKGAYAISVGTGGVTPSADAYTNVMVWTPNGYQGVIAYVSGSSTYNTICFISNQTTSAASATFDVLTAESAPSSLPSGISLGTVPAKGTMRVDVNQTVTAYSYSGTTETAGTATTLTGIQSNDRFTARINVGASPSSITVNCIQADPAGSKRAVPVLVPQASGGANIY
jgi:hypothetical protein